MDNELKPENVSPRARAHVDSRPLNSKEFGAWLKALREESDLTLSALGELTGYSSSHLSQIETGKKKTMPSPEYLEKLAGPLGVSYSDLLLLAGYSDLAKGVKLREAQEIFGAQINEQEMRDIQEQEKFIKGITDLKSFLEREVSPFPHYNGHRLTDQDKQRILDMLKVLFPEYR